MWGRIRFRYASGSIEEYGYTVSFDFKTIWDELTDFKVEIDEETKFLKDTRVTVLANSHNDY
jgi:hypothetical protein